MESYRKRSCFLAIPLLLLAYALKWPAPPADASGLRQLWNHVSRGGAGLPALPPFLGGIIGAMISGPGPQPPGQAAATVRQGPGYLDPPQRLLPPERAFFLALSLLRHGAVIGST